MRAQRKFMYSSISPVFWHFPCKDTPLNLFGNRFGREGNETSLLHSDSRMLSPIAILSVTFRQHLVSRSIYSMTTPTPSIFVLSIWLFSSTPPPSFDVRQLKR